MSADIDENELQAGIQTRDTSAAEAALHARLTRKRTKTGCLTCRRRRIKCDEIKPICGNCHKSRRQCEGYNQRPLFRPTDIQYLGPYGAASITFHTSMLLAGNATPPLAEGHSPQGQLESGPRGPVPQEYAIRQEPQQMQPVADLHMFPQSPYTLGPQSPYTLGPQSMHQAPTAEYFPVMEEPLLPFWSASQNMNAAPHSNAAASDTSEKNDEEPITEGYSHRPSSAAQPSTVQPRNTTTSEDLTPTSHQWATSSSTEQESMWSLPISPPKFLALQLYDHSQQLSHSTADQFETRSQHIPLRKACGPPHFLDEAAVQQHDDDYWDVEQGDDIELEITARILEDKRRGVLKEIVETTGLHPSVLHRRGFTTFIYDGILDAYRPQWAANPLKNPYTARVFAHFISATGPLLTTFVRQTRVPVNLILEGPLPINQQGLWTYIMPMAALHHQGLLQAILAISSLHIAKLQRASETPSLKHYGYALKHIHRNVRDPAKRHSVATLAATLLLAYYEILAANHTNWNTHVAGAKQLIVETDYAHMTKAFNKMKAKKAVRDRKNAYHDPDLPPPIYNSHPEDTILDQIPDVDEATIGFFAGIDPNYEDHGRVLDDDGQNSQPLDLVNYETFRDLFWWYCKQDVYQCILSGGHLMLDLSRWTDCPPRASFNNPEAVYGSWDHLTILLARIGEFVATDRQRKLEVVQANGGAWRPAPDMQTGDIRHDSATTDSTAASSPAKHPELGSTLGVGGGHAPAGATPVIPFYGMAPAPAGTPSMPASYQPPNDQAQATNLPDFSVPDVTQDLALATEQAIEEWNKIKAAADIFASALGPMFQPLGSEYQIPQDSPYGPVLFYRSWDISCVWAVYHLCLIVLIRGHPHMPPAAHMAAGVAAHQTHDIALRIGRIAAGVPMPPEEQSLNPHLAAALSDFAVPLFFAGIQYQASDQRMWLLNHLYAVDRRAGWATARRIAEGCQTAWVKQAAAGRGPPHEPLPAWHFEESRDEVWHSSPNNTDDAVKDMGYEGEDVARKYARVNTEPRPRWDNWKIGQNDNSSSKGTASVVKDVGYEGGEDWGDIAHETAKVTTRWDTWKIGQKVDTTAKN